MSGWYSYGVWSQIDTPGGNYLSCKHIANTFQEGKQLSSRGTLKHWGFRSINRSCPTCYSLRQIHTEVNHESGAKYSPSGIDYQERNLPLTASTSSHSVHCSLHYLSDWKTCHRIIKGRKEASRKPCHLSHVQYPSWVPTERLSICNQSFVTSGCASALHQVLCTSKTLIYSMNNTD